MIKNKAYIILNLITIILCTVSLLMPNIINLFIKDVSVTNLSISNFENTTYATGKIQEENKSSITYNLPIVTKDVFVKIGDKVQVGDKIATVDFDKTKQAILNLVSSASLFDEDILASLYSVKIDDDTINQIIPNDIRADFDGTISSLNAIVGNIISPTQSVAVISDLSSLQAVLTVPENYADSIKIGQTVALYVDALNEKQYHGKVKSISPTAYETLVGTNKETVINVYVDITDEDVKLKSGYSVSGKITTGKSTSLLTIPYDAINQDENNNEYVYIYQDGKAVKRIVTTGEELEKSVEIKSGIDEKDIVILDNEKITENNQYVFVSTTP